MLEGCKQQIVAGRKKITRIMIHQVELSVQPHRGKIAPGREEGRGRGIAQGRRR